MAAVTLLEALNKLVAHLLTNPGGLYSLAELLPIGWARLE